MADTEAQQNAGILESPDDVKTKAAFVRRWLDEIELSSKEEKSWRKTSAEAREVYEGGEKAPTGTAFNLYYSYIETVCPSLYNSTPIPDVRRDFNDKDPIAKEGADSIERCLNHSMDDYDFDDEFGDSVFDLATTGRGVTRVKYIAELTEDGSDVGAQSVECENIPWASFRRGPARSWGKVPWIAFADYMDKETIKGLNPNIDVPLNFVADKDGDYKDGAEQDDPENDVFKRALVWTVWDKSTRKVHFIAPSYPDDVVATVDDPLGLKQFFPIPRPMMTGKASGRLVPLSPYKILKPQVKEIDDLSKRINKLVKTLRPRGIGPGGVDVDEWAKADDGEIVEVSDVAKWLQEGGAGAMDKLIAWFPLDPTVKAIQELYARREQAKMEFFEVGGQADIMRGQSNPNEKLGTQQIKQNWGSLRLKKAQKEVERCARDLFRLKAELISEKFTPQNLALMTGIQLQTGDPEQDKIAMQKFDAMVKLLKDERMRGYRIDVETDSTIRGDAARNQEAMSMFVQGTAQYFAALAPAVEAGAVTMEAAISIYSAFARNFKLGKEVDATLDQLKEQAAEQAQQQAAQGPPENPEVIKAKAEAENNAAKQQSDAEHQKAEDQAKLIKTDGDSQAAIIKANSDAALASKKTADEAQLKRDLAFKDADTQRELALAKVAVDAYLGMQQQQAANQIKAAEVGAKIKDKNNERSQQAQGNAQLAKGMADMGKAIVEMGENLLKAQSAPKSIKKMPDGSYLSKAAQ